MDDVLPLYVCAWFNDEGFGDKKYYLSPLVKMLPQEYVQKTFNEVIDFVLDGSGDLLNDEYNASEKEKAIAMHELHTNDRWASQTYFLSWELLDKHNELQPLFSRKHPSSDYLHLDDVIGACMGTSFIKQERMRGVSYHLIELIASPDHYDIFP